MVSNANSNSRSLLPITPLNSLPQGRMGTNPIVLEQAHYHKRIPGADSLGKTMSLAGQSIQSVPQNAVEPLLVNRIRTIHRLSKYPPYLHPYNPPSATPLDSLSKTYSRGRHQRRTSSCAPPVRITIDATDSLGICPLPIAYPRHSLLSVGALACLKDDLWNNFILCGPKAPGDDKSAGTVLTYASPALARALFLTNDQKASTSTWLRLRSWTRAWVIASACLAAILSHLEIVSYLWPVISSAALRLPRRMSTRSERAISEGGVRRRYIAVPNVGPKERPQAWQRQRCLPPLCPLRMTWVDPQWGQEGLFGDGFRGIFITSCP